MRKTTPKWVAHVICNGGLNAHHVAAAAAGDGLDCAAFFQQHPEGNSDCSYGCLGLGTCVTACKFKAIFINGNGVAEVDRDECTACGACIRKCPKGVIIEVAPYNTINMVCANRDKGPVARKQCEVSCIACGICEKNCPADAIHVADFIASIDDGLCIACGMCAVKCPRSSIADAEGILAVIPVARPAEEELAASPESEGERAPAASPELAEEPIAPAASPELTKERLAPAASLDLAQGDVA